MVQMEPRKNSATRRAGSARSKRRDFHLSNFAGRVAFGSKRVARIPKSHARIRVKGCTRSESAHPMGSPESQTRKGFTEFCDRYNQEEKREFIPRGFSTTSAEDRLFRNAQWIGADADQNHQPGRTGDLPGLRPLGFAAG